jgi:hypothetical protein
MQLLFFMRWFACIRPGGVALVLGELACVQGSSLWFSSFGLMVCALCLSIVFVSDVSNRGPCLRGPRLVFFRRSLSVPLFGFRSLVRVFLFFSFLFLFSRVTICVCVVNALIKGEIEDHVWFEDRWMVASWCDE